MRLLFSADRLRDVIAAAQSRFPAIGNRIGANAYRDRDAGDDVFAVDTGKLAPALAEFVRDCAADPAGARELASPASVEPASPTLVFVYGSLMRDFHNSHLLRTAEYLGRWRAVGAFRLHSFGSYPGAVRDDAGENIIGELYAVDSPTLARLDRMEFGAGYSRELVRCESVGDEPREPREAFVYLIPALDRWRERAPIVPANDWRSYRESSRGNW